MTRKRIWVVSSGEYSDYSVGAAFESEKDALAAVEAGLGDDVEERVLFGAGELPRKRLYWRGRAAVYLDGRANDVEEPSVWSHEVWDDDDEKPTRRRPKVTVDRRRHAVFIHVDGRSREPVLKAVSDRFAQVRAELMEPGST